MEEHPFPDLKIDSAAFLDTLSGRSKCPKCERSRKYYCYTCYVPLAEIKDRIPRIKLPIKVDIIKHPSEVDGKSTAVHAAIVAPDDVTIYTYPCIPDYEDRSKVLLVFPGENSLTLEELAKKWLKKLKSQHGKDLKSQASDTCSLKRNAEDSSEQSNKRLKSAETENDPCGVNETEKQACDKNNETMSENLSTGILKGPSLDSAASDETETSARGQTGLDPQCPVERVVFVDSTWNQTKPISADERLKGLQCVELKSQITKFWRHQKDIPNTYLSTIEAIYYFLRDFHEHFIESKYSGEYDNIMFFFTFMHSKIRGLYSGGNNLLAYKKRKDKS